LVLPSRNANQQLRLFLLQALPNVTAETAGQPTIKAFHSPHRLHDVLVPEVPWQCCE
jgi:hypothetical protein